MKPTVTTTVLCSVLTAATAFGGEYAWTGAADAFWTNAANWTVGGAVATEPPGTYIASDGLSEAGELDSVAVFGTIAANAATIDLDGMLDVSNIVIAAGTTTAYTFGSSTDGSQAISIHSTGGVFRVESGAVTPILRSPFCFDRRDGKAWGVGDASIVKIVNNSSGTLVINNFHYSPVKRAYETPIRFEGTGNIQISSIATIGYKRNYIYLDLFQTNGGRLIIDCDLPAHSASLVRKIRDNSSCTSIIELTANGVLGTYPGMELFNIYGSLTIVGEGTLKCQAVMKSASYGGSYQNGNNTVSGSLTVLTRMESITYGSGAFVSGYYHGYNWGTTEFSSNCVIAGAVQILADNSTASSYPTLRTTALSSGGTGGTLGTGIVQLGNHARLLYTGEGGSYDQTIAITNSTPRRTNQAAFDITPSATIEQGGSGDLTLASPFLTAGCSNAVATLTLANSTAFAATFASVLADNGETGGSLAVVKTGSGVWRLTAHNTYTGGTTVKAGTLALGAGDSLAASGALTLAGGTLAVEADAMLPSLTVSAAGGVIEAEGHAVTLSGVSSSGGALNIVTGGGSVFCPSLAGSAPGWLTVNGLPVETIGEDGLLRGVSIPHDVAIAATGDTVPDAASQVVGITTAGGGGNDSIAAAVTTVKGLVQKSVTASTIEIGDGRSLAADVVAIRDQSESLTIGTAGDAGSLTSTDMLEFRNDNAGGRELTANVGVSAQALRTHGAGTTVLAGGAAADSLSVEGGTLHLTGAKTYSFDDIAVISNVNGTVSTLLVDGGADVVFGRSSGFAAARIGANGSESPNWLTAVGRLVVSNATVRGTAGAGTEFADGGVSDAMQVGLCATGILDIRAGAVVSNRLVVGGSLATAGAAEYYESFGAVYLRGGELVTLGKVYGNYGTGSLFSGYGTAQSYLQIDDGDLTAYGTLTFGSYRPVIFHQRGGSFRSTNGTIYFGGTNCGRSHGRFSGGVVDLDCSIYLTYTFSGAACNTLTVESGTGIDNHARKILANSNGYNNSSNFSSTVAEAYVNLNGGWLRTAGIVQSSNYNVENPAWNYLTVTNHHLHINFNGGVWKTGKSECDIFCCDKTNEAYAANRVVVYAGGATIDTEGKTGNFSTVPFSAPLGRGVTAIRMDGGISGMAVPPFIDIDGDGRGATAIAEFDEATGAVTNIVVTSAGEGYTHATALLRMGKVSSSLMTLECELADNVATGSFTKAGEGDFKFAAANTYGGATVLAGGTLVLGVPDALPPGTTIVPNGGALASTAANFPSAIKVDVSGLDPNGRSYALATFTDEAPAALPALTVVGADRPKDWTLRLVGNVLRVGYSRGSVFIIR